LTTSASDEDILQSYRLHDELYITKKVPWASMEFLEVVEELDTFAVCVSFHAVGHAHSHEMRQFETAGLLAAEHLGGEGTSPAFPQSQDLERLFFS